MNKLGEEYEYGDAYRDNGPTINDPIAASWYRKAAEAGNPDGMYNLGLMYVDGRGVKRDQQQAIAWYRKAAALGDQYAIDALKSFGQNP